ncbi:MAG: VWA domain-containing protein [Defluviitaleaceae bacterium]|nr:VWA domain-containing protein [Defluviitaleaceae bacterium]
MKTIFKKSIKAAAIIAGAAMLMTMWGCGSSNNSAPTNMPTATDNSSAEATAAPTDAATAAPGATSPSSMLDEAPPLPDLAGTQQTYPDEEYLPIVESSMKSVATDPLITFSLKVDTASYRNVARYLDGGNLPPADAVRVEEMMNYFNYDEVLPENDTPFSIYTEIGKSPFDANKDIAFVRVKSKDIDKSELPKSNLTFLIDSSGSMDSYDKLPLLKSSFGLLVDTLTEDDMVSIVTYAGSSAVVLDSVSGDQKERIMDAINGLQAGGSTAGASGINTAYQLAEKNFVQGGNNRVILATDGDFNVGVSSVSDLEKLISQKRDSGVYLTVLGFGTENLKDNKMETLAKNGNGNYSYIDSVDAGKKVLVDEMGANLYTIADDVKAQIEFNPARVSSYRLVGYENDMLANSDFNNDAVDAGEIGVGTDVVLMFEFTTTDNGGTLKYQDSAPSPSGKYPDEFFEVRIRYKDPGQSESQLITEPVKTDRVLEFNTSDFTFATCVAGFGELLRGSDYAADINVPQLAAMAKDSLGEDKGGYRREFVGLMEKYEAITGK